MKDNEIAAALRLALEALEKMMEEFRGYDLPYGSKAYALAKDARLELLTALRQAIDASTKLEQAQKANERSEVEPVIDKSAAIRIATSLGWTPPCQWVGLTDEEFLEACKIAERGNYLVAFKRIQEKLKEKNQ